MPFQPPLNGPRHHRAVCNPAPRDRRRARRPRRAGEVAHRLGKTLAFAIPLADRIEATDRRPGRAGARAHPGARDQIVDAWRPSPMLGRSSSRPSMAASESPSRHATPPRPTSSWRRPGGSRTCSSGARLARAVRFPVLDEAVRDARHGLPPGRRPHRRAASPPSARRCSSPRRWRASAGRFARAVHARPGPTRDRADPSPAQAPRASLRGGRPIASTRSSRAAREARSGARVRAHQAGPTGWSSGWARRRAAVAMHGDKPQGQRSVNLASFERARWTLGSRDRRCCRGIHVEGISHGDQL